MASFMSKRFSLLLAAGFIIAGALVPVLASAQTAPAITVQSVSPSSTVGYGTEVTMPLTLSGFTGSVSYSLSDSFSGSSASASDITPGGTFVWIPTAADGGAHTITITATDTNGNTASASEQIVVIGPPGISIQSLEPGASVTVGQTVTFLAAATSVTNPTYSVSDSFSNSSILANAISSGGSFVWTPLTQDIGTHTLTVTVRDVSGNTASASQIITVTGSASLSLSALSPGSTVAPGQTLSFNVNASGIAGAAYTVSDSYSQSSLSNANINTSGYFSWTPTANDAGTHNITINVTDIYGHVTSVSTQILVSTTNATITASAPSPSNSVSSGTTIVFTLSPSGFTNPTYSIKDSLGGSSISNSDINSSGYFDWTPSASDAGTHLLTITAVDSYGHSAATTVQLTVNASAAQTTTTASTATSSAVPAFTFSTYLSPGITNNDVTELQTILTQQGLFSGPITGYYGPLTEAAVIAFQSAHGIDQLGVVGPSTRAALNQITSGGTAATTSTTTTTSARTGDGYVFNNFLGVGSTGTDVTELQQRLTALNLYSGPITGYYGSLTEGAVEAFQGQHNIEQVGYVGPATRAALNQ